VECLSEEKKGKYVELAKKNKALVAEYRAASATAANKDGDVVHGGDVAFMQFVVKNIEPMTKMYPDAHELDEHLRKKWMSLPAKGKDKYKLLVKEEEVYHQECQSLDTKGKFTAKSDEALLTLDPFLMRQTSEFLHAGMGNCVVDTDVVTYVTTVVIYFRTQILASASRACEKNSRGVITPRHMQVAVTNSEGLHLLLGSTSAASGQVPVHKISSWHPSHYKPTSDTD